MDIYPDPASPLARTAADDVRAMFTARIGEQADSHELWNAESTRTIRSLVQGIAERVNADDPQGAVDFAALWAATYLGAMGLLADQLLQQALARAYIQGGGPPDDNEKALAFMREGRDAIVSDVFAMLNEEGRTIV